MMIISAFIKTKSTNLFRFILEQILFFCFQMLPGVIGLVLRGVVYRIIIKSSGLFGMEENVQLCHSAKLRLGKNVFIGRNCYLGASDGGIELGDNACLLEGCYLNVFNYNNETYGRSKIVIESNAVLSRGCTIHGHSGVFIGKETIIGPQTTFLSGNHGDLEKNTRYRYATVSTDKPIIVGTNVWIGTNVSILPGVKIGDNSVIAAGSVVNDDVPANSIYAGNPGRLIGELT